MKLSEFVKQYRREHSLSLRTMAEMCHCSYQYLSKLENNEIETPQLTMLVKLADGMNMTVHSLLDAVDDMTIYTNTYHFATQSTADPFQVRYASKLAKNQPRNDIADAYEKADEKTKRAVRIMLGLE